MENTTDQAPKRSFLIWGIPILILVVLIVLLTIELTSEDETVVEQPKVAKEEVIQPTEDTTKAVSTDVQPLMDEEKDDDETAGTGETEAKTVASAAEEGKKDDDDSELTVSKIIKSLEDEEEKSYIVEEGDSLWKIASKKDILGNPWKWRTILIQNKEKINYTIYSEETGEWKVMVDAGKRLIVKPEDSQKVNTSFDRTRKKRYAVQLMSLNTDQLERAVDIVKMLIKEGYHAYLYRTREKIKSRSLSKPQHFYRIRVGFYETEGEALAVGEDIIYQFEDKRIFPPDYWAVLPSYSELNGELIDFGIQRNKPWIIQLAEQSSRSQAIEDLKALSESVDYSYISQKRIPNGGFIYRTRVGFFETKSDAEQKLASIQRVAQGRFVNSQILELRHAMETALGQSTGKTSLKQLQ